MEVPTDITISVLNRGWAEMSEGKPYSINSSRTDDGGITTWLYVPHLDLDLEINNINQLIDYIVAMNLDES